MEEDLTLSAREILLHAAGDLDICSACGNTGEFDVHTEEEFGWDVKTCPVCGAEQIDFRDEDEE